MKFNADDVLDEQSAERALWTEAVDFAIVSTSHAPGIVLSTEELMRRTYAIGMIMKYGEAFFAPEPVRQKKTVH